MTFSSDGRAIGYSLATPSRHRGCPDQSYESRITVICRVLVGIRLDTQLLADRISDLLPGTKVPFRSPYGPLSKQELNRLNLSEQKRTSTFGRGGLDPVCLSHYSAPVVIIVGFNQTKKNVMNKAVCHDFPLRGHRARSIVMHT
jgi:hypothetical protein